MSFISPLPEWQIENPNQVPYEEEEESDG